MAKKFSGVISLFIDTVHAKKSVKALSADLAIAKRAFRGAEKGSKEYKQALRDIKKASKGLAKHASNVKNVAGSWGAIKKQVSGMAGPLGGLFTGPGAVFALGVAGAGALAKHVVEVNKKFDDFAKKVEDITGITGTMNTKVVGDVQGIAETFDKDFNEVLIAANALSKQTGGSISESITLIEKGFLSGADATGEFLQNLKEYPSALKGAQIGGEDLIRIIKAGAEEGIFSDKGIDSVKEFGIRIREQTNATKTAMENAFGKEFSNKIFDGINDGSLSVVDALKLVSNKMNDTTIPTNNLRTVIADVFGGAGEDAGEDYLKSLGSIIGGTEDLIDTTSELTTQKQLELDVNQKLAESQAKLANSVGEYGNMWDKVKSKAETALNNTLGFLNTTLSVFSNARAEGKGFWASVKEGALEAGKSMGLFSGYASLALSGVKTEGQLAKEKMDELQKSIDHMENTKFKRRGHSEKLKALKEELKTLQDSNPTILIDTKVAGSEGPEQKKGANVDEGAIAKAKEEAQKVWDEKRKVAEKEIEKELALTAKAEAELHKIQQEAVLNTISDSDKKIAQHEIESAERIRIEAEKIAELKAKAEDHKNYTQQERDSFLQAAESHEKTKLGLVEAATQKRKQLVDELIQHELEKEYGKEQALKASSEEGLQLLKERLLEENETKYNSALEMQERLKELAVELGIEPEVLAEIEKNKAQEVAEFKEQLDNDYYQKLAGKIQQNGAMAINVANTIADVSAVVSDRKLAKEQKRVDNEIKILETQRKKGLITEEQFQNKKATLEDEFRAKERAIKRKQFITDKIASAVTAGINTAVAVTKVAANIPLAIAVGALGAAQIGVILAKPTPEFKKGGVVRGASHAQGGIHMVDSITGQKVGEMEHNEPYMILSDNTYRNNKPIVDSLLDSSLNRGGAPIHDTVSSYRPAQFQSSALSLPMFANGGVFGATSNTEQKASAAPESMSDALLIEVINEMRGMNGNLAGLRAETAAKDEIPAVVRLDQLNEAQEEQKTIQNLSSIQV